MKPIPDLPYEKPDSPYQEGANMAATHPDKRGNWNEKSPYPPGSHDDRRWWDGFSDWTEERYKGL